MALRRWRGGRSVELSRHADGPEHSLRVLDGGGHAAVEPDREYPAVIVTHRIAFYGARDGCFLRCEPEC